MHNKVCNSKVSIPHWSDYNGGIRLSIKKIIKFQFHIGPITTRTNAKVSYAVWTFQFHIGPITTSIAKLLMDNDVKFQFHIGPITTKQVYSMYMGILFVSIPHWSDYNCLFSTQHY